MTMPALVGAVDVVNSDRPLQSESLTDAAARASLPRSCTTSVSCLVGTACDGDGAGRMMALSLCDGQTDSCERLSRVCGLRRRFLAASVRVPIRGANRELPYLDPP
jgi:hypothetical protein